MDARRLELYELLKPKLDEEPARELVLALPADPENLATKDDLRAQEERVTGRMDVKFAETNGRFAEMMGRLDRLESVLTRRMIAILGTWTILVGSTVGWVSALLR